MSLFLLCSSSSMNNVLVPFIRIWSSETSCRLPVWGSWKVEMISMNLKLEEKGSALVEYYHLSEGFNKTLIVILTVMIIILCCVQRNLRISRTRWTRTMNKPSWSALVWKRNTTSAPSWISTTRKIRPCVTSWLVSRRNPEMVTRSWRQFNATWNSAPKIAYTSKYLGDGLISAFFRLSKCCRSTTERVRPA